MDDLFENIKKSFDHSETQKMPEGAWEEFMEFSKNKEQPERKNWIPYIFAGFLAILLLFSNLFWLNEKGTTSQNITDLRIDTVYITKYVNENNGTELQQLKEENLNNIQELLTHSEKLNSALNHIDALQSKVFNLNTKFNSLVLRNDILNEQLVKINKEGKINNSINISKENVEEIYNHKIAKTHLINTYPLDDIEQLKFDYLIYRKKTSDLDLQPTPILIHKTHLWRKILPRDFSIEVIGGIQYGINQKFGTSSGFSYGLFSSFECLNNFRPRFGLVRSHNRSVLDGDDSFDNVPTVEYPENSELENVVIDINNFSFHTGLDYLFSSNKKWTPFIGLEWIYNQQRIEEFNFEFNSDDQEIFLNVDDESEAQINHAINTRIGIRYNLSRRLNFYWFGSYAQSIKGNKGGHFFTSPGILFYF